MPKRSTIIFKIQNQSLWFVILNFLNNAFEVAKFLSIVGLTAVLRFKGKTPLIFSSFYFCLVKEG